MIVDQNKIYEMFGRKQGDFMYRTPFRKRTFKDTNGDLREVEQIAGDDDGDHYRVSEAFTTKTVKEYNILKNIRDRFQWYKSEGYGDGDAINAVAADLLVPVEQVRAELEYFGLQPSIGRAGDIPANSTSPVRVTSPGYRDNDFPVTTRESRKRSKKNLREDDIWKYVPRKTPSLIAQAMIQGLQKMDSDYAANELFQLVEAVQMKLFQYSKDEEYEFDMEDYEDIWDAFIEMMERM